MPRTFTVTTLQPALRWLAPMQNMHLIRQEVERVANAATTDLVVLPEAFLGMPAELDGNHEHVPQARQFIGTLARAIGTHLVAGTLEHREPDGKIYNSAFVIDPGGNEIGRYDKRKLFSLETESRTPGTSDTVVDINGVRVSLLICADLWYPELARAYVDRADLLVVPVKSSVPSNRHIEYARHMWMNLALTRSMENALPVIVSDWAEARHTSPITEAAMPVPQTYYTSGGTSVVDPSHRPMVDKIQSTLIQGRPGHLTATIDLDALGKFRDYRRSVGLLPISRIKS
jgi:predicted amidohydrolase